VQILKSYFRVTTLYLITIAHKITLGNLKLNAVDGIIVTITRGLNYHTRTMCSVVHRAKNCLPFKQWWAFVKGVMNLRVP